MNKQEQLQEQYEDALFALIMDKIATAEGQWAMEENERLKEDPSAAVPEELDKRCMQMIRRHFAKQQVYTVGHFTAKIMKRVVMAAGIAALMFTGVFAASETVRINTMNLIIEVFEDNTDFRFVSRPVDSTPRISVGWVPDGYILEDQGQDNESVWYQYRKSESESLYIDCSTTVGGGMGVDTEEAEVEYVEIRNSRAMLIKKELDMQLVWTERDNAVLISLYGAGMNQDDLLCVANELVTNYN